MQWQVHSSIWTNKQLWHFEIFFPTIQNELNFLSNEERLKELHVCERHKILQNHKHL